MTSNLTGSVISLTVVFNTPMGLIKLRFVAYSRVIAPGAELRVQNTVEVPVVSPVATRFGKLKPSGLIKGVNLRFSAAPILI